MSGYKPLPSFVFRLASIFLISLLTACSPTSDATQKEVAKADTIELPSNAVANHFFSEEEMEALINIKTSFEKGLRSGMEKRSIGYAYSQNALRMKLDFMEKVTTSSVHPFDGGFRLEEVSESLEKLPFVSKKCGYGVPETEEVINYYCLALDDNYFKYLRAIPGNNSLINGFASTYQEFKEVSPALRQTMLMDGQVLLDLNNWDHQLFYLFFQCWRNEELAAYFKVTAQSNNQAKEGSE